MTKVKEIRVYEEPSDWDDTKVALWVRSSHHYPALTITDVYDGWVYIPYNKAKRLAKAINKIMKELELSKERKE